MAIEVRSGKALEVPSETRSKSSLVLDLMPAAGTSSAVPSGPRCSPRTSSALYPGPRAIAPGPHVHFTLDFARESSRLQARGALRAPRTSCDSAGPHVHFTLDFARESSRLQARGALRAPRTSCDSADLKRISRWTSPASGRASKPEARYERPGPRAIAPDLKRISRWTSPASGRASKPEARYERPGPQVPFTPDLSVLIARRPRVVPRRPESRARSCDRSGRRPETRSRWRSRPA